MKINLLLLRNIFLLFSFFIATGDLFSQNIAINTSGTAAAATNMLEVTQTSAAANMVAIYAINSGATAGTGYGLYSTKTGAGTANVAGYFSATGGTANYAGIFENGNVGIGTTTPGTLLHVFSSAASALQVKAEQTNTGTLVQFIAAGESGNAFAYMRQGNSALAGTTWGNMPLSASFVSGSSNSGGLILNSSHVTAPMVFVTGGSAFTNERMRIEGNTGNIGIGTTTPAADVDITKGPVNGYVLMQVKNSAAGTSAGAGYITYNDANKWAEVTLGSSTATTTTFGVANANYANFLTSATMAVGTSGATPIIFGTTNTERMRIEAAGNVGIGTSAPSVQLDVQQSSNSGLITGYPLVRVFNPLATIGDGTTTYNQSQFRLEAGNSSMVAGLLATYQTGGNFPTGLYLRTVSNHSIFFTTNNTNVRMTVEAGGNIGIGTTAPGYKLDVAGAINTSAGGTYSNGGLRFGSHTLNSHTNGWLYVGDESGSVYGGRGIAMGNCYVASALYYPNGSQAAGKVLISDVNGLATWGTGASVIGASTSFPDGMASITARVLQNGASAWTYTVPAGKNFYITSYYSITNAGSGALTVGGTTIIDGLASESTSLKFATTMRMPIIVAAGTVIAGPASSVASGFEVNANVTPVTQTGINATAYTVTAGKTLVIMQTYMTGGSNMSISIDGGTSYSTIKSSNSNISGATVENQPLAVPIILPAGTKVKMSAAASSFNGYEF